MAFQWGGRASYRPPGYAHCLKTCFWWINNPAMKLPWRFLTFVSSLLCRREQGVDAGRTLYGQGGEGKFFASFCRSLLWPALHEIKYCKKMFFGQEYFFKMTLFWGSLVFTFQDRQKSEGHNTIYLTFRIRSVKQISEAPLNCQSSTIIQ